MALLLIILSAVLVASQESCPIKCKCITTTVRCTRIKAEEVPQKLPIWAVELYLNRNQIEDVSASAFENLKNLRKIDLSHNSLEKVDTSFLLNVPNLKTLILSHNKLQIISFPTSHNLWRLMLSYNQIFDLKKSDLLGLQHLKELDLSHNRLSVIHHGSFLNGSHLETLNYQNNEINMIEPGSFDQLTQLTQLQMKKNKLAVIPKNLFQNLSNLNTLDLSHNYLSVIPGLAFKGLTRLKILKLKRNEITSLPDGAFFGLKNISELYLDGNMISNISKGWLFGLESLQILSLSRNHLRTIESESWKFCENLLKLDLSHNRFTQILVNTFEHLSHLLSLNLSSNLISYIHAQSLKALSRLQELFLGSNSLSFSLETSENVLNGLSYLVSLDLSANHLRALPNYLFVGLNWLENLNLAKNNITTIQENCFAPLTSLRNLGFTSSHLVCDCRLAWLAHWLKPRQFPFLSGGCLYPEDLRGRSIYEIGDMDLNCYEQFQPKMIESPVSGIALKNKALNLTCRVAMAEGEEVSVKFDWMKDQVPLSGITNVTFGKVVTITDGDGKNVSSTELSSHLLMSNISDEDAGIYQCVVSHRYGNTYSERGNITVFVFPVFNEAPRKLSVKAGSNARLDCSATGQPTPKISFHRYDVDPKSGSFPAAVERRVQVLDAEKDRDVFDITNVKVTDSGIYSCIAKNEAGVITVNISLTVLEPPSVVRPSPSKTSIEGACTLLKCIVSGTPSPSLEWRKDGSPLHLTERHIFASNNQSLVIVQTEVTDAGIYECVVQNYLGMDRGVTHLSVIRERGLTTLEISCIGVIAMLLLFILVLIVILRWRYKFLSGSSEDARKYLKHPHPSELKIDLRSSQLFCDRDSEHSSKDSGTGTELCKQSVEELTHEGTDSLYLSDSHPYLDTPNTTPKLTTFHPRPTNHERYSSGEGLFGYVP